MRQSTPGLDWASVSGPYTPAPFWPAALGSIFCLCACLSVCMHDRLFLYPAFRNSSITSAGHLCMLVRMIQN
uniref:Uncharacterized protein n=1 Tax=Anguilla anguilla TaxID=7936 RepID=A0A0E9TPV9_ANGAN